MASVFDYVPTLDERLGSLRKAPGSVILTLSSTIPGLEDRLPGEYLQGLTDSDRIICLRASLVCWAVTKGQIVPREMQLRAILADQRTRDSLISAGTGSGKTLPIAISVLLDDPTKKRVTIMVSPLKRLQETQETEFQTRFGISTVAINEDTPRDASWWSDNIFSTKQGTEMRIQLIIVTVEQLFRTTEGHFPRMAVLLRQTAFQNLISRICIDEAHFFYTAGSALYGLPAFRPAWGKLNELKVLLKPSIPWHLFSATFPPHILTVVQSQLLGPRFDYIHITSNRPNIIYATHQIENNIEDLRNYECFLTSPYNPDSQPHVLLFFDDKKLTTRVVAHLETCLPHEDRSKGIVRYYHSSMSKRCLKKVHEDFVSPTGNCKILVTTFGESVGVDFPNVGIVGTVGLPATIVDALQRGGRAIRIGDKQALFVVFYESWAHEINQNEFIDSGHIGDPDRPRGKLRINSQRRDRAACSSIKLVQCTTCLRKFYADYLDDRTPSALAYTGDFCCDRHNDGFDLEAFLPGKLYKATCAEKRKADTPADGTQAKLQPKTDRVALDDKITAWLDLEIAADPLGRPYYHVLSDGQKKNLLRIAPKDLTSPATIIEALDESEEWGNEWAGKLFNLIVEHDMSAKAAKAQHTRARKAANREY